jgi:hypothetical protein
VCSITPCRTSGHHLVYRGAWRPLIMYRSGVEPLLRAAPRLRTLRGSNSVLLESACRQ